MVESITNGKILHKTVGIRLKIVFLFRPTRAFFFLCRLFILCSYPDFSRVCVCVSMPFAVEYKFENKSNAFFFLFFFVTLMLLMVYILWNDGFVRSRNFLFFRLQTYNNENKIKWEKRMYKDEKYYLCKIHCEIVIRSYKYFFPRFFLLCCSENKHCFMVPLLFPLFFSLLSCWFIHLLFIFLIFIDGGEICFTYTCMTMMGISSAPCWFRHVIMQIRSFVLRFINAKQFMCMLLYTFREHKKNRNLSYELYIFFFSQVGRKNGIYHELKHILYNWNENVIQFMILILNLHLINDCLLCVQFHFLLTCKTKTSSKSFLLH